MNTEKRIISLYEEGETPDESRPFCILQSYDDADLHFFVQLNINTNGEEAQFSLDFDQTEILVRTLRHCIGRAKMKMELAAAAE